MFHDDLESDNAENFKELYYGKNVQGGIINLSISTKNRDWNLFSDQDRKDFLIEKWKVLFNNLSDDYFVADKSEVIDSLEELRNEEWKHAGLLFKKKLKYNKETYSIVMDISVENAKLALLRDSDEKRFILRDYEKVWRTMSDANFKNFKLDGDILTFENKASFLPAEVFDLKQIVNVAI
ncbi:hypothetical protein SAMN05443633_104429 [Chryseobacterium arachidis]|uniref:Uncharacterized protein n=1 Tax=Chryseobacterium arachidis TaxID=1416778 RepID=A0A1M5C724_9FLAO|nr:hypothetical protein [Chryseobacterium arachidis]SHF50539.1 hypothetical protein SAMN05443633_104429 [Chryseobacterium arachidis]